MMRSRDPHRSRACGGAVRRHPDASKEAEGAKAQRCGRRQAEAAYFGGASLESCASKEVFPGGLPALGGTFGGPFGSRWQRLALVFGSKAVCFADRGRVEAA